MRKVFIISALLIALLTVVSLMLNTYEERVEEVTYSIKSEYLYLSKGEVSFDIKLYSNDQNSLLKYAKEADATIHDKNEDNVVTISVIDSYLSSSTYLNEALYEYTIKVKIPITKLKIEDCYLTLKFENRIYILNIGNIEIEENIYVDNNLKITNLYGVSSVKDLGVKAVVLSLNNSGETNIKITGIKTGNNINFIVNNDNKIIINESSKIEDYLYKLNDSEITIKANENNTYIIPIKTTLDCYLYNFYLLFDIDGKMYYLSNFTYVNSNDLEALENYIHKGIIYDI